MKYSRNVLYSKVFFLFENTNNEVLTSISLYRNSPVLSYFFNRFFLSFPITGVFLNGTLNIFVLYSILMKKSAVARHLCVIVFVSKKSKRFRNGKEILGDPHITVFVVSGHFFAQ